MQIAHAREKACGSPSNIRSTGLEQDLPQSWRWLVCCAVGSARSCYSRRSRRCAQAKLLSRIFFTQRATTITRTHHEAPNVKLSLFSYLDPQIQRNNIRATPTLLINRPLVCSARRLLKREIRSKPLLAQIPRRVHMHTTRPASKMRYFEGRRMFFFFGRGGGEVQHHQHLAASLAGKKTKGEDAE